ncbi:MAG: hypothetical protein JWM78_1812 [Verrucomicrobiaceae bacterium]|nr:hypothetical protein [Verrucomicrobiaceae bacterium]
MHKSKIASLGKAIRLSIAKLIPLIALSILVLIPTLVSTATAASFTKSITVVMDDNYPPYTFRDQDGQLDGYLIDMWKLWQEKTGVSVNLVATDWAAAIAAMAEGKADVIDTIFVTPERSTWLDFAPPYAEIPVSIFAHKSIGGIADVSTLRGFLVGGKAGDARADKLAAAHIDTLKAYKSYSALIQGAVDAEIKVFCLDEPPATYLLYKAGADQNFRKHFTLYTGQFHRAVRKDDRATLQLLAQGFDAISPKEQQKLWDKWMGSSLRINPWARYSVYGFTTVLLVGVLLGGWGMLLRRQVAMRTRELENERARLRTVLSTLPDLVWLKDINGIYLACNRAFESFFGAKENQIIGKTDDDFIDRGLPDFFRKNDLAALTLDGPVKDEKWLAFSSNHYRGLFETIQTPMRDAKGNIVGVLGIAHDVTKLMQSREVLDFLAYHDPLTKLPNRLLFRDRLDHAIERAHRESSELAILFIDLDRFKNVNDALGHTFGDDLLREVAQRMAAQIRASDTLARLGGDEFILLIQDHVQTQYITTVAEKLLGLFASAWHINDRSLFVSASIGISRYPINGVNADTLIKHADTAMYRAKELGRNTFHFFE